MKLALTQAQGLYLSLVAVTRRQCESWLRPCQELTRLLGVVMHDKGDFSPTVVLTNGIHTTEPIIFTETIGGKKFLEIIGHKGLGDFLANAQVGFYQEEPYSQYLMLTVSYRWDKKPDEFMHIEHRLLLSEMEPFIRSRFFSSQHYPHAGRRVRSSAA